MDLSWTEDKLFSTKAEGFQENNLPRWTDEQPMAVRVSRCTYWDAVALEA